MKNELIADYFKKHTMKKIAITILACVTVFASNSLYGNVAVLPYRLLNESGYLKAEMRGEYAKMVATGTFIKKGIDIYSARQLAIDLKELSLDPDRLITRESLEMLGSVIKTDHILLGTLSRIDKEFRSESLLYSVRDNRIISRASVKSGDFYTLAEREIRALFFHFPDIDTIHVPEDIDAALVIDLSYNLLHEWDKVKEGIDIFAKEISCNWSTDIKIHILPVSDHYKIKQEFLNISSNFKLTNITGKLKPRGRASLKNFEEASGFAVNNIHWRREAFKTILMISGSPLNENSFLEKYALEARRKGIIVNTISTGLLKSEEFEYLRQISIIGGGHHFAAAYRQRVYNADGKPIDIFFEGGRLFHSLVYDDRWQEGLYYSKGARKSWNTRRPVSFLDEIIYNIRRYKVRPDNISEKYGEITGTKIINTEKTENNMAFLMKMLGRASSGNDKGTDTAKNRGKAMITDGRIFIWIEIRDESDMKFFERQNALGSFFSLGVRIQESPNDPYGITMNPAAYVTGLGKEYIPSLSKTDLKSIIEKRDYYMSRGLFSPPVWFIDVKVEKIEWHKKIFDVRDGVAQ